MTVMSLSQRMILDFDKIDKLFFNNKIGNGDGVLQAYHCQRRQNLIFTTIVKLLYIRYTYVPICEKFGSARAQLGHVVVCTP